MGPILQTIFFGTLAGVFLGVVIFFVTIVSNDVLKLPDQVARVFCSIVALSALFIPYFIYLFYGADCASETGCSPKTGVVDLAFLLPSACIAFALNWRSITGR